jgi:hypothetical protein
VRPATEFLLLAAAWLFQAATTPAAFREFSYQSRVLGAARSYRVLLPSGYDTSRQRYPVVYWLPGEGRPPALQEGALARYVAAHELILVDSGPAGSDGRFAMCFPELVGQIDGTLRTVADRSHRALAGLAGGGFQALFLAGKYPDLVGSASSFEGKTEAAAGPEGFPVECTLDDFFDNYDGVRTRVTRGTAGSLAFYQQRLDSVWTYARSAHESVTFLTGQDLAEIAHTLDFHVAAFARPLPAPRVFSHADAWPNFEVWGWEVVSSRRQPGFTVLENVSNSGFRSSVREYLPAGAAIPEVKLSIGSPPIYPPGVALTVTYIHLLDGKVRRAEQRVDAHGRLNFDLSGDAWEVGVSAGPLLTVSGYTIEGASWATAGRTVKLQVRFWNKGGAPSATSLVRWESDAGVKFVTTGGRLLALAPGESATLPVTFTANATRRAVVKIVAVCGGMRVPVEVPLFPPAEPTRQFQIADGRTLTVYRHATEKFSAHFGEGNGDGHAALGETFAVLLPDGAAWRAAELFTNDACVESVTRGSDSWEEYDHAGASAKYSLPSIRPDCAPGHMVHMLARILVPDGAGAQARYRTLEFPVWQRNEGK